MRRREHMNPQQHLEQHLDRAARRYVEDLDRAGLQRSKTLERALAERTLEEAKKNYEQEARDVRDHNISVILHEHKEQMNTIKRQGASLRLKLCPPIALLFGGIAWYQFHLGDIAMGVIYTVVALAFLAMLVLGAIFDRPQA